MPAPIVVPNQRSPWEQLLPALFLNKIRHKQDIEREELRIKARQAQIKEQRGYKEGQELTKEKRAKQTKIEEENRKQVQKYKEWGWTPEEEVVDPQRKSQGMFKVVGGKVMYYPRTPNETPTHYPVWKGNKWEMVKKKMKAYVDPNNPKRVVYRREGEQPPEGTVPYSSPLVKNVINTKQSIADKKRAEAIARIKSPQAMSDVINDVKKIYGNMWNLYTRDPQKRKELIRSAMDSRVKILFPDAKFGRDGNKIGWFVPEGNGHKLEVPWSE